MPNRTAAAPATSLPDFAVEAIGLSKIYQDAERHALDAVNLTIPRGSIFGLLGPNGAGKSTLINILGGSVLRSAGSARIWGHDIDAAPRLARGAIGIVPQEVNIDPFFTPREILEFQAGLYAVPRRQRHTDEILDILNLSDKAEVYSRTLSGGMRRRLLIAKALVHAPPVLVLDEPTAGVDVDLRRQLWGHIRELNRRGVTIILTTHYLEEAEALCDTVAIINLGQVIACEATEAMLRRIETKDLVIITGEDITVLPAALDRYNAELTPPRRIRFTYRPKETRIEALLAAVAETGLSIADLTTVESDLEDVFLQLTAHAPSPAEAGMGETKGRDRNGGRSRS